MERPQRVTHALVDGVRFPNALQRLYRRDDLQDIEPLYLMTRWSSLAEQGPVLVHLQGDGLLGDVCDNDDAELYRALSFLSSHASMRELSHHLAQFVTFSVEGHEQLLRFADPLVTRHWLSSYGDTLPAELMGPLDTWWVADWAPLWAEPRTVSWQTFCAGQASPENGWQRSFPPMGSAQLAALDAVDRWQLKERLADHFNQHAVASWRQLPSAERGQWLDDRLDDAIAWGAYTERQLAIWLSLSLEWGEHFMTEPYGLYARWWAQLPEPKPRSRQEQLYALDAWSRSPEATPHGRAPASLLNDEDTHG